MPLPHTLIAAFRPTACLPGLPFSRGAARVPLIIAGPGIPHGRTEPTLTSLLDVFATFVDVGGAAPPGFADGYSLLPVVGAASNDKRPRPDHVAAMAASDSLNAGQSINP